MADPLRGEVWFGNLDPVEGHEQGGRRPVLIISSNRFNRSASELVVVAPITSVQKGLPSHVEVAAGDAGLTVTSFIKVEDIRCISKRRLMKRLGAVDAGVMTLVEQRLRWLLEIRG